jgi:hypothetical protein
MEFGYFTCLRCTITQQKNTIELSPVVLLFGKVQPVVLFPNLRVTHILLSSSGIFLHTFNILHIERKKLFSMSSFITVSRKATRSLSFTRLTLPYMSLAEAGVKLQMDAFNSPTRGTDLSFFLCISLIVYLKHDLK